MCAKGKYAVIEFIQQYTAELISGLAVILSAVASWRAFRAEKAAEKVQKAIRRTDMLVEIERKNAVIGKLALVTAQKILLLQRHPQLVEHAEDEISRLSNNLILLQEFMDDEEKQYQVAEAANGASDIDLHSKALTDIQRLRVRLEADVEKESDVYGELLEESRRMGT